MKRDKNGRFIKGHNDYGGKAMFGKHHNWGKNKIKNSKFWGS